ncbi:MAG: MFS transporter, partial [Novosphingobium sp.]
MIGNQPRPFWGTVIGGSFFRLGNTIAAVALPWLILDLTASATLAGVTASASLATVFLGSLAGGFLIDRYGARTTATVAGVTGVLCVALVPVAASLGPEKAWVIVVLSAFGAFLDAPGMVAQDNRIPEMAAAAGLTLTRALSAKSVANNAVFLSGPAIAGATIGAWGLDAAFWIAASCNLISVALSLAYLAGRELSRTSPRVDWLAGLFFILRDPPTRRMLLLTLTVVGCNGTIMSVQLPALFQLEDRSATDLGFAGAALGAGAVVGAILLSIWKEKIQARGFLGASIASAA